MLTPAQQAAELARIQAARQRSRAVLSLEDRLAILTAPEHYGVCASLARRYGITRQRVHQIRRCLHGRN